MCFYFEKGNGWCLYEYSDSDTAQTVITEVERYVKRSGHFYGMGKKKYVCARLNTNNLCVRISISAGIIISVHPFFFNMLNRGLRPKVVCRQLGR